MGRVLVFFLIVMVVLAGTGIFDQIGQREGGEVPRDVLRLHIRAHSDAPRDQETKLAVRDAVLAVLAPGLRRAASAAEACQLVKGQIGEITAAARKELQRRGNQEPVTVRLGLAFLPGSMTVLPFRQCLACRFSSVRVRGQLVMRLSVWWTGQRPGGQGRRRTGGMGRVLFPSDSFKTIEWFVPDRK